MAEDTGERQEEELLCRRCARPKRRRLDVPRSAPDVHASSLASSRTAPPLSHFPQSLLWATLGLPAPLLRPLAMEVDGWRLTPFSSVPPDARALALDDPSAPSQTSAEATVDVEIGRRFWLNLTHPAFVAEPNQYELELSAGGNRISHALLDLGSSADG